VTCSESPWANRLLAGLPQVRVQLRRPGWAHRRPQEPARGPRRGRRQGVLLAGGARRHGPHRALHRRRPQRLQRRRQPLRTRRPPRPGGGSDRDWPWPSWILMISRLLYIHTSCVFHSLGIFSCTFFVNAIFIFVNKKDSSDR
jgi:hypothetical protein